MNSDIFNNEVNKIHKELLGVYLEYVKNYVTIFEIIKHRKLLNYVFKNPKCAKMYHLTEKEMTILKEVFYEN